MWAWGLDLGSRCLGVGFAHETDPALCHTLVRWRAERERKAPAITDGLKMAYSQVYADVVNLADEFPPATIAWEKPSGTYQNPRLMLYSGVILLAIAQATGLAPWECNVSTWKDAHRRHGVNLTRKDALLPWGCRQGLATTDLDELAAAAIAKAAAFIWWGAWPEFPRSEAA